MSSECEEVVGLLQEVPGDLPSWGHWERGCELPHLPRPPSGLVLLQGPSQDCPPPEGFWKEPLPQFPA